MHDSFRKRFSPTLPQLDVTARVRCCLCAPSCEVNEAFVSAESRHWPKWFFCTVFIEGHLSFMLKHNSGVEVFVWNLRVFISLNEFEVCNFLGRNYAAVHCRNNYINLECHPEDEQILNPNRVFHWSKMVFFWRRTNTLSRHCTKYSTHMRA